MPRSFRGYDLEKKIGSGGMSTLYRGIQTALNRPVAIKMLHPGLAEDESFIARFEREAKAASQIGHRNIVGVIDFGVDDDVYYIIMELVTGMDMKDALDKTGRVPPEIVLTILEEVGYGLEAAHEAGVVHRDIKPGNVMLSTGGEIKIADFGLARQQSDMAAVSALTMAGTVLGTPAYMSPEQAAGKEVDGRTDIFSLGVMAFELLTGQKPFSGSTYSEIREKIINQDPPSMGGNTAVTPEIEALVRRMLAKDPDRRFPSMRHVLRAVEDCMETLDPTGGLFKHKRKYLTKFAQNPAEFSEDLRRNSISSHLDRGYFYQKQGLTKIGDAIREFRYVLFLDPDNSKASEAIHELEKQAEESGVRVPKVGKTGTRELPPDLSSPRRAVGSDVSDPDSSPGGTKVLSGAATPGATQIVTPKQAKEAKEPSRVKAAPGAGGAAWIRPVGIGAAIVILAVIGWRLFGGAGGPSGALALASEPTGAAVFVRGPGETEFRNTGLRTDCRVEDLAPGTWEVRLEKDGFKPQLRRIPVGEAEESLSLALVPIPTAGKLTLAVAPEGAVIRIRRPGDREFREIGAAPLAGHTLDSGAWEIQAAVEGGRQLTKTVEIAAEGELPLTWNLDEEFDQGRIEVTSDPAGASVRIRRPGERNWTRTGKSTPVTLDELAVGGWQVRVDKNGYQRQELDVQIERGAIAPAAFTLDKATPQPPPAPRGDGYASIVIVPFADIYLDGRIFENQARRTVVPLAAGKKHEVELRHPAFGSKKYTGLSPAPGDTLDLGRYDFKWAQVRVFCVPTPVADLLIDGQQVERQTPFSDKLGVGKRRFAVRKSGWKVAEVVVTSGGGESRLTPNRQGEIEVDIPADVEVRVQFILEKEA